jgi:hypothetical protein
MAMPPAPDSLMERVRRLYATVREHKRQLAWHREQLRIAAADLDTAEQELGRYGLRLLKTPDGAGVIHGRDADTHEETPPQHQHARRA